MTDIDTTQDERAARVERVLPLGVRKLCRVLADNGHGAWVVGGCVRDVLMGREASDWDIATSAQPDIVQKLFRRTIPTGIQHGTVTVLIDREQFEVTTLRGEAEYSDGRRPDHVFFVTGIDEDLGRRDFTVNAIAYDPVARCLVDPWKGLEDLSAKVIRAVRDPLERFHEDGLRVLRAARFVSSLEFALDEATEAGIAPNLATFAKVSPERIRALYPVVEAAAIADALDLERQLRLVLEPPRDHHTVPARVEVEEDVRLGEQRFEHVLLVGQRRRDIHL